MTPEDNIAARGRFGAAMNSGNPGAFDTLLAPDAVDHDLAPGQVPGQEGYRGMVGDLAPGQAVTFRAVQVGGFEDGLLAEHWGGSEQLGRLTQLGLAPQL